MRSLLKSRAEVAFTLVELLIVVVILGILAAIVIPQTIEARTESREQALTSNLAIVRRCIEVYFIQHHEKYPDEDIEKQLTATTNRAGKSGPGYGPYLTNGVPPNPINGKSDLRVVTTMPSEPKHDEGWVYATDTGEFRADLKGGTSYDVDYFDL